LDLALHRVCSGCKYSVGGRRGEGTKGVVLHPRAVGTVWSDGNGTQTRQLLRCTVLYDRRVTLPGDSGLTGMAAGFLAASEEVVQ